MDLDKYDNINHPAFSHWASEKEIKESLLEINDFDNNTSGGIPLFYQNNSVFTDPADTHSLVISSTGSKKTRLVAMPAIRLFASAGESFVATDPKAELYEKSFNVLKNNNYNIFVLNLRDTHKSNRWNPLSIPRKLYKSGQKDKAMESLLDFVDNIVANESSRNEPFWENSSKDLFTGLLLVLLECAKKNEVNFKSLMALRNTAFNNTSFDDLFINQRFLNYIDNSCFIHSLLNGTAKTADVTRDGILSTFDQFLRPFFSQNNLMDTLSGNDIDLASIGKSKTAVFIIVPDENSVYNKIVTAFIKQCYSSLISEAQNEPSKKLPLRVNFLLDEFSSLPPIPDFPNMLTAARSRNIRFHLIMQSENQLRKWYGVQTETIKANCENWIFLHSRELNFLKELVELTGFKDIQEPLSSVSTFQTLNKDKGEALVLNKRKYPYITRLADIDGFPPYSTDAGIVPYPVKKNKILKVFDFDFFCKNNIIRSLFGQKIPANLKPFEDSLLPEIPVDSPEEHIAELEIKIKDLQNKIKEENLEKIAAFLGSNHYYG